MLNTKPTTREGVQPTLHVPKPTTGIEAPVFRVTDVAIAAGRSDVLSKRKRR